MKAIIVGKCPAGTVGRAAKLLPTAGFAHQLRRLPGGKRRIYTVGVAVGRTRQTGGDSAAARDQPPDATVRGVIEDIRAARLHLSADLSTAAAALDAEAPAIASEILAGDLADVAAFRAAAMARLADEPVGRRRPQHNLRSRALLALPAVPLLGGIAMSAAAALGGGSPTPAASHQINVVAPKVVAVAPQPTASQLPAAAHSTLQRLEVVVTEHPHASQVIRVATDLHRQLTDIIATSSDNPTQLDVVKQLLTVEQQVLEGNTAPGSTLALAASRQVTQLLDKATTPLAPILHPSTSTAPTPASHPKHANATHRASSKSGRHHSSATVHRHHSTRHKRESHAPTPSPTPSQQLFGTGLFNGVL